jgi:hypothetical protein
VFFNKNVVNMTDQTSIAEPKELSIEQIKEVFPDEWVLIGDPVMDESGFNVLSGTPLYHSRDKREVAYLGREKRVGHRLYTLLYTGTFQSLRSKIVTLYKPQIP